MPHRFAAGDPDVWNSAVEAANPGSILVVINWNMGEELRQRLAPEDVLQETLLKAWQARANFEWQDIATFRHWLLAIAKSCIADHRDYEGAAKRDSRRTTTLTPASHNGSGSSAHADVVEPWGSTTPSRIAVERETAQVMEKALRSLPDEVRDVVRLRLFEDLPNGEVAMSLGISESAVRRRFHTGAEIYRVRVRALLEPETGNGSAAGFS